MLEGRGCLPRVHDKFENTLKRNRGANSLVPLFLYLAEKRVDRSLRIKSVFSRLIFSRARFTDSDVLSRGLLASRDSIATTHKFCTLNLTVLNRRPVRMTLIHNGGGNIPKHPWV